LLRAVIGGSDWKVFRDRDRNSSSDEKAKSGKLRRESTWAKGNKVGISK